MYLTFLQNTNTVLSKPGVCYYKLVDLCFYGNTWYKAIEKGWMTGFTKPVCRIMSMKYLSSLSHKYVGKQEQKKKKGEKRSNSNKNKVQKSWCEYTKSSQALDKL